MCNVNQNLAISESYAVSKSSAPTGRDGMLTQADRIFMIGYHYEAVGNQCRPEKNPFDRPMTSLELSIECLALMEAGYVLAALARRSQEELDSLERDINELKAWIAREEAFQQHDSIAA